MNQCQMLGFLYPILFLQNTHIMSAEECIMAADFQNQFPNPCSLSGTGYFGSKFVTVCVSGNETNQISLKGYQVCTCHVVSLYPGLKICSLVCENMQCDVTLGQCGLEMPSPWHAHGQLATWCSDTGGRISS